MPDKGDPQRFRIIRHMSGIRELIERSLMPVTALSPQIGYDKPAQVANPAHANSITLREEALRLGFVTAEACDRLAPPVPMS